MSSETEPSTEGESSSGSTSLDLSKLDFGAPQEVYDRIGNAVTVNGEGHVTVDVIELLKYGTPFKSDPVWEDWDYVPYDGEGEAFPWGVILPGAHLHDPDSFMFRAQYRIPSRDGYMNHGIDPGNRAFHGTTVDRDGIVHKGDSIDGDPLLDIGLVVGDTDLPEAYMAALFYENDQGGFDAVYFVLMDEVFYRQSQAMVDESNEQIEKQYPNGPVRVQLSENQTVELVRHEETGAYWNFVKTTYGRDENGDITLQSELFSPVQVAGDVYVDGWVQEDVMQLARTHSDYSGGRFQMGITFRDRGLFGLPILMYE